jgi:hypothetical protein
MATEANTQANNEQNTGKVTFDDAQQARVNELIQEAMGRAAREAKEELKTIKTQFTELQSELTAAKAAAAKAKTPGQKAEAADDIERIQAEMAEVKNAAELSKQEAERLKSQLQAKDKEVKDANGKALEIQKTHAMLTAASQVNFVDVNIVTKLTGDQVKYDDASGKFVVLNEQGTPRMNSAFEPMTLAEFYQEYANKHSYLVRGDVKGGAGSSESQRSGSQIGKYSVEQIFGKNSNAALANKLAKTDYKEYSRLKIQAKEQGLI